jgi:hypothetical protein
MKRLILTALAGASLLSAASQARAWTYNDGDVLLIIRKNSQDIEFNIGNVTNFLGKTNGYTTTVSNWDPSLVTSTVGSLTGAKIVLLATSTATNWLSSAEPNTTAYNISAQDLDTLHGVINGVGVKPLYPIAIPTSGANSYVIDSGGQYRASSYDYVVSGGQFNGISKLGGNAPFTVEQAIPGLLDFWQVKATDVYPNSPPDQLIGTFYITNDGVLTFVAGPRASTITKVTRNGNSSTVTFTTTVGNSYSVAYTNKLGAAVSKWPVDATTIIGDGTPNSITHTATGDVEFYNITTQ